jgi:serine phosphatase RsbU (regulator of sigma subunit)
MSRFFTHGVVEARDAKNEMFGFERTKALSSRSAHDIAAAAQQLRRAIECRGAD